MELATGAFAARLPEHAPIEHIVFIIKENRTYDALFGGFAEGEPEKHRTAPPCPADDDSEGVEHGRTRSLDPSRHVDCHDSDDAVPVYHALARAYSLCARYFTEVRGPSFPNHLMMISGEAPEDDDPGGVRPADWKCPRFCYDFRTLPDQVADAGRTWRAYDKTDFVSPFAMIRHLKDSPNIVSWEQFAQDARAGSLPNLSYVLSDYQESEHPPASLCRGQDWTLQQLQAVAEGPQWPHVAVFIVWDDWGGLHDHIKPPTVERDKRGRPLRYGYRVPCIVVSPYARQGYISVQPHSHLSLVRFAEDVFGLPPLNRRVAESSAMADCFDFAQATSPARLPSALECRRGG